MSNFLTKEELAELGLASYGEDVLIGRHAVLYSPGTLHIGNHVRIDDFTIVSPPTRTVIINTSATSMHLSLYDIFISSHRLPNRSLLLHSEVFLLPGAEL